MGAAPAGVPTGSPGASANAMAKLREAVKIMQDQLPHLPQGSPIWQSLLKNIQSMGKYVGASDEIPGIQKSTLRELGQQAQQQAPMQALMRSLGGAGTGGPSGSGSPGAGGPQPGGLPGGSPSAQIPPIGASGGNPLGA